MLQVYIWGAGNCVRQVAEEIDLTKAEIAGILDQDERKQGTELFPSLFVCSPQEIPGKDFDYVVVSIKNYESVEKECVRLGIAPEKVICYWKEGADDSIFVRRAERIEKLVKEKNIFRCRLDSAPYEWEIEASPRILRGTELLEKIYADHSSLCRFGDGEFEMIREKERPWFQKSDPELSRRLKEVLFSEDSGINIAVAQNFVGLEQYKEAAADAIREYMYGDTRREILQLLNSQRCYYDTYVTRPYIIYKDKKNADEIFPLFKKIWNCREVVIVEGEYSRIGIGNDLMKNARSLSRILCPSQNAWDKYQEILHEVLCRVSRQSLICISLGPSATVLAYDLAKEGYQALDIGQLDNEYEWYLREAEERIEIPGKMVAEIAAEQKFEIADEAVYKNQIIARIV